jgi:hypothetical protein
MAIHAATRRPTSAPAATITGFTSQVIVQSEAFAGIRSPASPLVKPPMGSQSKSLRLPVSRGSPPLMLSSVSGGHIAPKSALYKSALAFLLASEPEA